MNETLLPVGCYDVLPPFAGLEDKLSHQLLNHFESYGYDQVSPPLIEYSESLLAGRGAVLAPQVIRVMDPQSQKIMGFRTDITLQIGRIAQSRLGDAPRPLRLCYAGDVIRMQTHASMPKRQRHQIGIELIGADSAEADAEVILIALRALQAAGTGHITLDINLPLFIGTILAESSLDNDELSQVFEALAHKDNTWLKQFQEPACDLLCELMLMSGPAIDSLNKLEAMTTLPEEVKPHIQHLRKVVTILEAHKGQNTNLILDVTERGGLDYYSGISFAFFATEHSVELGRGGRYTIDYQHAHECAIGCTFYTDSLQRLLPQPAIPSRVYVVEGTSVSASDIERLHDQGHMTTLALEHEGDMDVRNIARKLGCEFIYQSGNLQKL